MCIAELTAQGRYRVAAPEPVGLPGTLFARLLDRSQGRVFVGFDFPIGVPTAYARLVDSPSFGQLLRQLGRDGFSSFFDVAACPSEISPERPFYPRRPGGSRRQHLVEGLGVAEFSELLRHCELKTSLRGSACSLFWTLGGQQVGRAAIAGWRDVLQPALRSSSLDVALWPFDGELLPLLKTRQIVVAETYPAEAALHLGLDAPGRGWSKRSQADRRLKAGAILRFAAQAGIVLDRELERQLLDGFGAAPAGEDRFDATLGLLSMLNVVLGRRDPGTPPAGEIRSVEGWILGQEYVRQVGE